MNPLVAIGITAGVLAGLWTQFSTPFGLIPWVGFLSWACFFAAGGKRAGLLKTIPANLSGVLWGSAIVWGSATLPIPGALGISVTIAAFAMCVQARWSLLSFIPGAFAGCAAYFGTGFDLPGTCLALIAGACLGWISEYTAGLILAATKPVTAPTPATQPTP
ncbi:DUF1097 domain-containing protein [Paeniglutamicibacter gangotriensis]|uniref:DUF1097 domain-containing protein n=1 Tax=Paeniglutamicibacter gangotriensis TaxID=254787 RepID=A0A5B0EFN6_9MICC|nr:DUF1097 domain-containing protein [Paeniglutamicibacter gangotriensis]KAA0977192.1 DUF1097 domain-containing protein [Paeniglutamicibacter gangotriensis]